MIKYDVHPFGPLVIEFQVEEELTNFLLEQANKLRKNKNKRKKQNANFKLAGHLKEQYSYDEKIKDTFMNKLNPYHNLYREVHCQYHKLPMKKIVYGCPDLWVNFMKPKEYNPMHTHYGDYSFVLFLQTPDLSKEKNNYEGTSSPPGFLGFHFGEPQPKGHRYTTYSRYFEPKKNLLIMFPCLLQHWVSPFTTDGERISVSGNLVIQNKKQIEDELKQENFKGDYF